MPVIRAEKKDNFTVMSNTHLRDKNLSLKAAGLMSIMLSLPDDWNYSVRGLAAIRQDGEHSVRSALQELEHNGYIKRTRKRDEKGAFTEFEYEICEKPFIKNPHAENPHVENPHVDNPHVENRSQINTKETNTKKRNTYSLKGAHGEMNKEELKRSMEKNMVSGHKEQYIDFILNYKDILDD